MKNSHCRILLTLSVVLASTAVFVLPASAETPTATAEPGAEVEASGFVAYYFHGNLRCATCRKIEAYSEEAISEGFAHELTSGRLVWLAVNTDEAEHKHFVTDFELVTKSLVLVEYQQGEVVRFENLDRIWKLVGAKDAFLEYVNDRTRKFIGSS